MVIMTTAHQQHHPITNILTSMVHINTEITLKETHISTEKVLQAKSQNTKTMGTTMTIDGAPWDQHEVFRHG